MAVNVPKIVNGRLGSAETYKASNRTASSLSIFITVEQRELETIMQLLAMYQQLV
jgi:hypothetical protein